MGGRRPSKGAQTFEAEIMREARAVARLERRAADLRAQLRSVTREIVHGKKTLRALVNSRRDRPEEWPATGAASKVLGIKAGA